MTWVHPGPSSAEKPGRLAALHHPHDGGWPVIGVVLDFEDSCGVIPDEISDAEVLTGDTITGNVCWQIVSSDATGLVMYDDAFLAPEEARVYLALT